MNKRKWTLKQRKIQACNLRRRKIWEKSTGPRTPEGKARVAKNSVTHGLHSREFAELRRLLRMQRAFARSLHETVPD